MLRQHAKEIYTAAIQEALPKEAVQNCLSKLSFGSGKLVLISIGKAGWAMAKAAYDMLADRITGGVIVTKYDHSCGPIGDLQIVEAGHPIPDDNSLKGARLALDAVSDLTEEDTVLFLISGGGSALFELTTLPLEELQGINSQLLAAGADIKKINTVRKRMSLVKGGRFAAACGGARIVSVILSDIIDDQLDMIASGPTCPDSATCAEAMQIIDDYAITLSPQAQALLQQETPKTIPNAEYHMCGSVRQLCATAERVCRDLGYTPTVLTDQLSCTASEAGRFLGNIARTHARRGEKLAFIAGGETVVYLTGTGKGGRNQELALAAAEQIAGISDVLVFSVGSDGTDGPTDAAGGVVDGSTRDALAKNGISISQVLRDNDAYHALQACDGLIFTGATGTNVNDLSVLLIG